MTDKFADIRPYNDEEIPAAMQRIVGSELFPVVANYIYPGEDIEMLRCMFLKINTIEQFQYNVMYDVYKKINDNSITQFSYSGFDTMSVDKGYLFVSNHRDIVLDSLLLQYALYCNRLPTSEITFGENLMSHPFIVDIGKSNKMFKVFRSGNMREFMEHSKQLSEYIRDRVVKRDTSIWIAQRNGRTKDGTDITEHGLTKMLGMSSDRSMQSYIDLNIKPMAISYEIEPCDAFKTQELYLTKINGKYVKQQGEDLQSIVTGITHSKGRVHLAVASVSPDDFAEYGDINQAHLHKIVAEVIDKKIHANYKLFPNNYIAHDMRSHSNKYGEHYTNEQKEWFVEHYNHSIEALKGDRDELSSIFLGIYANPVDTAMSE
ncbi:MAG: acyltransferase [Bacteroidales bacterium]|nr:acyltransferase [Bacteroidales bacterium]MDD4670985.1 acyltransferase [Bacteroidales bacterium]